MQKAYKFEEAYKKPIPLKKYIYSRNSFVNYLKMNYWFNLKAYANYSYHIGME